MGIFKLLHWSVIVIEEFEKHLSAQIKRPGAFHITSNIAVVLSKLSKGFASVATESRCMSHA